MNDVNDFKHEAPLVSILIPCFNNARYVGEAIDSALRQTYPNIEVIVINDGSTDGSEKVLASYGDRITWKSIKNSGACAARNEALRMSRGEFIQFLDSDDLLFPEKVERQLPLLVEGKADLVFCKGTIFGDGKPERPKKSPVISPNGKDAFVYTLRQGLSTPAPLHRRSTLEQVDGFRTGLPCAQEYDLHVRLAASGVRIKLIDECLVRIRHHSAEARISQNTRPAGALLRILIELSEILLDKPLYRLGKSRRKALASLLAQHAIYAYRNGARNLPTRGFILARRLDAHFEVDERPWYRAATRAVGHLNVERLLSLARGVRSQLQHAAS